jgi:hypothetical protein
LTRPAAAKAAEAICGALIAAATPTKRASTPIAADGGVERGPENQPGDGDPAFCVQRAPRRQLARIARRLPAALAHNNAVIRGVSGRPSMHDLQRRAAFTIGTGLGNAV